MHIRILFGKGWSWSRECKIESGLNHLEWELRDWSIRHMLWGLGIIELVKSVCNSGLELPLYAWLVFIFRQHIAQYSFFIYNLSICFFFGCWTLHFVAPVMERVTLIVSCPLPRPECHLDYRRVVVAQEESVGKLEVRTLTDAREDIEKIREDDAKNGPIPKSTPARDSIHTHKPMWLGSPHSCCIIGYFTLLYWLISFVCLNGWGRTQAFDDNVLINFYFLNYFWIIIKI